MEQPSRKERRSSGNRCKEWEKNSPPQRRKCRCPSYKKTNTWSATAAPAPGHVAGLPAISVAAIASSSARTRHRRGHRALSIAEGHTRFWRGPPLADSPPIRANDDRPAKPTRTQSAIFERPPSGRVGPAAGVVDVELPLEGKQAIVHHLRRVDCDYRPLAVSMLARTPSAAVVVQPGSAGGDRRRPRLRPTIHCGPGRRRQRAAFGGGCSTCSQGAKKEDVGAYLAKLRGRIDERARVPLL